LKIQTKLNGSKFDHMMGETMPLPYDPTRTALYSPEKAETIWTNMSSPSLQALAAEASRLAYYRAEGSTTELKRLEAALGLLGFVQVKLFVDTVTGSFGFGTTRPRDNLVLIAFRGSQPDDAADFATDASLLPEAWALGTGCVHRGFAKAYAGLHEQLQTWFASLPERQQFLVTGHSMGGALAALAAADLKATSLITFGCPRVGDTAFCQSLSAIISAQFVHCCDIVARLPPRNFLHYDDICKATYIDQNGAILGSPSEQVMESDRSSGRTAYFQKYAWRVGSVILRDLADHAPMNYIRAFY
jgi:pimeloyl-ACP methyl ester carboxylesterase